MNQGDGDVPGDDLARFSGLSYGLFGDFRCVPGIVNRSVHAPSRREESPRLLQELAERRLALEEQMVASL